MNACSLAHKTLSAFDLDKTLLRCNSSFQFSKFLYQKKYFSIKELLYSLTSYVKYAFLHTSLEDLHHQVFRKLFQGALIEPLEQHALTFVKNFLIFQTNPVVMKRLDQAKKEKHTILLLSSTPEFLLSPISQLLGIELWKGTQYEIDKEGKMSHISFLMDGKAKAETLITIAKHLNLPLSNTVVYSDSNDDLPFLKAAGRAICVNPNKKLRALCHEYHWEIL